jgi:two-component system NtrC family response regulator
VAEQKERVLVVEDAPDISSLLAYIINRSGRAVDVASDGDEALRTFKPDCYSLVIVDVHLGGGLDGIALALKMLSLEPGLRIVLMSGSVSADAERAKSAGLGPILAKPFEPDQVLALLRPC